MAQKLQYYWKYQVEATLNPSTATPEGVTDATTANTKAMTVYLVTNVFNGKVYVGRTQKSIRDRWYLHCKSAKSGSHIALHRAIRKYGPHVFLVRELAHPKTVVEFDQLEKDFIAAYDATNPKLGYNRTSGGNGFSGNHSEETRDKMRKAHTGKLRSEESRQKQGKTTRGLIHSGVLVSQRRTGKKWSDAHKERFRENALKQWAKAKDLGKTTLT